MRWAPQVKNAEGLPKERLDVTWKNGRHKATLRADLTDMSFEIIATRDGDDHEGDLHSFKCALLLPFHHISAFVTPPSPEETFYEAGCTPWKRALVHHLTKPLASLCYAPGHCFYFMPPLHATHPAACSL